ncbi:serine/threonine-protein kinase TBK1 [Parasteatoda tepidariorum]|nr:serine/threonine-protein kinase TBK1 [Parasteatoda tepidariorum]
MNCLRSSSHYMWSTTDVLGKGATGSVYRGVHKKTGEAVAVKTFNHTSHLRPLEVQMREFEVMKKLTHENIVKMVAIEEELESQKKILVMELCDAGSLFTILDDPQNSYGLEEEEFQRVLKDLSAGMKYLRDNNTIHRDLKPGNIMKFISVDGRSIYKLTDFGAARELDDDEQFMSLYGTEEYLHPDMYERAVLRHPANKPFRATVDLWSIGVTLYHVATGSLPFRPFGGRKNRETMHYITTTKASGVISGVQHSEKGPIEWSRELPKTCLLNQGLRDLVTVLLAGILECHAEKMWTFDQFFECAMDIISRRIFHVFYMNEGKEICLYMKPTHTLQDLKEQITLQTKVPVGNQMLLFDKTLFSTQVHPTAEISTYPTTSQSQPIVLVHTENPNVKDLTRLSTLSACFPNFPSSISPEHDAALAKTCCSVAHAVKRIVVKLVRSRDLLLKTPKTLISVAVDTVSKLCTSCDTLKQKTEDLYHRCDQLEKSTNMIADFLSLWPNEHDCDNELQTLNFIVTERKQFKEQVKQKFIPFYSAINTLKQRVLNSMHTPEKGLQAEWEQLASECSHLTGCIETADTYVRIIRGSWQSFVRDRNARGLSLQDEQFHILEKIKVQHTSKKLEALLQEQCLKSCLQASNKLDEWFSGMQATMVQCKYLKEDLAAVNSLVKSYGASLQEAESQAYDLSIRIISSLRSSESKEPNQKQASISIRRDSSNVEEINGEVPLKMKRQTYTKVFAQLQNLKKEHSTLWEIAEENNILIEKFGNMLRETN